MLKWLLLVTLFLTACTDYLEEFKDEYGSSVNSVLPEKVETIDQAIHLNCNEEIKCAKVYVEEVKDYFFCNGTQFVIYTSVLSAKVCPAEEGIGDDGYEEGDIEGESDQEGAAEGPTDSDANSTDSGAESTDSNEGGEGSEGGEEVTGPTGDVVSCLQDSEIMGMKTKICTETTANSETAEGLKAACVSSDVEGFKITSTEGTGCSAETGYVKKCVVSNDAAVYYFDADAANKSCEELTKKD